MKDYKLISSGANGKLYYAMGSASDELEEIVEFADRVYVIDEGKNYIWTGSQFIEDLNPDGGSSGSGSEPLVVHLVVTQEENYKYVTFDKNWATVKNAFPNVCIEVVTEDDGLSGLSYDSILTVGSVEELEQYFINVSDESTVYDIYEKKVFSCVSPDGMPFFRYSIVV